MQLEVDPSKPKQTVGVRVPPEVLRVLRVAARERGRKLGTYLSDILVQHASKEAKRRAVAA